MNTQIVAESSVIECDCRGALEGNPETMCESCLDAYLDAVLQQLKGPDLFREVDRVAKIVSDRLQKDPELADAVKQSLEVQVAVAMQRRPIE